MENSILQELVAFAPKHTETELRSILGCFLFTGDDVFKKIKVLSGGEKSRVALAKALTADANFLVLDEPTNHLDMASVNILIQALQQYEGTFIVVSHDRYFLDNIANKIWYIEEKEIKEYPGTYQEFEEWNSKRVIKPEKKVEKKVVKEEAPKEKKNNQPTTHSESCNKRIKNYRHSSKKINTTEQQVKSLEVELAQEAVYSDAVKLQETTRQYNSIKATFDQLQTDWELLAEEIMGLEN